MSNTDNKMMEVYYQLVRDAFDKLQKGNCKVGPLRDFGLFKGAMEMVVKRTKGLVDDPEKLKVYITEKRSPSHPVFGPVFRKGYSKSSPSPKTKKMETAKKVKSSKSTEKGTTSTPEKKEINPKKHKKDWKTAAEQRKNLKEIEWLWDKWIVKGNLTFLFGEAGKGKSALLMRLIASITKGEPWPNGTPGPSDPHPVIWCETEANQTLNDKHLVEFGVPDDLVLYPNSEAEDFQLESATDMSTLRRIIHEIEPAAVVVDSLTGGLSNEGPKILRHLTVTLRNLARDTGTSIIIIHHARKVRSSRDRMELNDLRGTSALGQLARSVIGLDEPSPERDRGHMRVSHVKCNFGIKQPSLGMKWKKHEIVFCSESPQPPKEESMKDKAGELLKQLLAKRPQRATFIKRKCEEAGINFATAKKAKKEWGITSKKVGVRSYWFLPGQTLPTN